ncbi:glucuronate isomerase [Enterococcus sp.]|uniref:glucuronate isomerase n=1 Tax=Enterococcus sp. TaxID=35783 RepID=UPI0025C30904|nr:glucuronate isomerase [Enterococcus sp.]
MFIDDDFLLKNETAKQLYHEVAKRQPIIDYHCHLEPQLIAENFRFKSITELWLGGDHYKWRAMRANGVAEKYITGDADDWEKFYAWAQTVENLLGNPLHHWTHLELKEYFGITKLLTSETAAEIYEACNQFLANNEVSAQALIRHSNVKFVGTTDDILSDLQYHKQLKAETDFVVAPSFRPDPILNVHKEFAAYISKCQKIAKQKLVNYVDLKAFLLERVSYFHDAGCKSADHGFSEFLYQEASDEQIEEIYQKGLQGESIDREELAKWQGRIMTDLASEYAKRGWIMQIHFGALRNTNHKMFVDLGPDSGGDAIIDQGDLATNLNTFLDCLNTNDELPQTILYNLNPIYNELVAATCGNFQGNTQGLKSKLQFGAAWWFNDHYDGMINQMNVLATQGLLMNFVGMLTDSRSFISYPRHDYFRRILCQYIGEKVESGHYPKDEKILTKMVEGICYTNARDYFGLDR